MFQIFRNNDDKKAISIAELITKLQDPEGMLFVDVREKNEWDSGHVSGFRHIPLGEIPSHLEELIASPQVYFMCRSGGRSARATEFLTEHGHPFAVNISGGWIAWQNHKK